MISMEGTVVSIRRGRHTTKPGHFLIQPFGVDTRDKAAKLVGKKVTWQSPVGKNKVVITGKVAAPHGGKGIVRAIFEKGLPGQAVTTSVKIE